MEPLGALSGGAGGMADAVAGIIEQRMNQARLAETVRSNQAAEAFRQKQLEEMSAQRQATTAENVRYHNQLNSDRVSREGAALNESMMPGTDFSPSSPMAPYLSSVPKMVQAPAPPEALAADPTEQGPVNLPGTIANAPSPNLGRLLTKTPSFKQADTTEKSLLAQQAAESKAENDRLKTEAAANKADTLVLSAAGKAAMRAIEGSGPLTDQALAMMEKEFPGIQEHPEQYNEKSGSMYQRGKYWLGYSDPSDPRQQIEQLLKPIQAGQFTQSSRSYKMVELALEHMADPSQTPARQYEAMKQLRSLMPELRDGIIRGERPINLKNKDANSYFGGAGASQPGAPPPAAAPAGGAPAMPPKEQRTVGMEWDVPNLGPSVWTGSGWQPKPRPNPATPASAGVAATSASPAGPSTPLDTNRLPEVGTLPGSLPAAPAAPASSASQSQALDTNRLPETGALAAPAPRTLGNTVSAPGKARLQHNEGNFQADPYPDVNGLAIGYGMHTFEGKPVTSDLHITQAQADAEMDRQIKATYGANVDRALRVPVTQKQYDMLVSMSWNLPAAARHVIGKLNRGEPLTEHDFQQSATVGNVPHRGLQSRRTEEAAPFMKGTP